MKTRSDKLRRPPQSVLGFTLVEMMVAVAIGVLLMGAVMSLYITGLRSFAIMGNYQDMDNKSCKALDILNREIRNASALVSYTTNRLTFYNTVSAQTNVITYDSTARTLVLTRTGQAALTNLTECDSWSYQLFTRAPLTSSFSTNIVFSTATSAGECKIVQMSWKCSRKVLGTKMTTESVQTAQIVLRNKTQ